MTPDEWRRYTERCPDTALLYMRAGLRWEDLQTCPCFGVADLDESQRNVVNAYELSVASLETCELVRCVAQDTEHRLADPDRATKDRFLLPSEQAAIFNVKRENGSRFAFRYWDLEYADTTPDGFYQLSKNPGELLWGFFANTDVDVPSFTLRYESIDESVDLTRDVHLERGQFMYAFRGRYPLLYMKYFVNGRSSINTRNITPVYVTLSRYGDRRCMVLCPMVMGDEAVIMSESLFLLSEEKRCVIQDLERDDICLTRLRPLRDPYAVRDACCTIQRTWRTCISDPNYVLCRRRLAREFETLATEIMPSKM